MPIKPRQQLLLLGFALCSIVISLITTTPATAQENSRQRYRPVTLTQEGWHRYGPSLLYSGWQYAFKSFSFYGKTKRNTMFVGGIRTITIDGTTSNITRLISFFPQTGKPGSLMQDYRSPARSTEAGALAGEVIALTLNIAFNDVRIMPRHPGYDLEDFTLSSGPLRGYKLGKILDIGNRVLGGDIPLRYGFPNHQSLTDLIHAVNANYEFIDYNTFIERGFLVMNRPYGQAAPPHNPHVP